MSNINDEFYNKVFDYPWDNVEFVQEYLAQTYFYVTHSEKLLCLAMSRIDDDKTFRRFKEHLGEEAAHDKLALRDLKRFDTDISNHKELALTKAFYQTQYYLIEHKHPLALLGYIFFLEDLIAKVGPKAHGIIAKTFGTDSSFVKLHYEEDEEHVKEAAKLIDSLPDNIKEIVNENHKSSAILFFKLLDQIKENMEAQKVEKAA